MQTTAILVDDEPLVLDHLGRKLRRLWSELDILGEAHSGSEALAMIRELQPDIVFWTFICLACRALMSLQPFRQRIRL